SRSRPSWPRTTTSSTCVTTRRTLLRPTTSRSGASSSPHDATRQRWFEPIEGQIVKRDPGGLWPPGSRPTMSSRPQEAHGARVHRPTRAGLDPDPAGIVDPRLHHGQVLGRASVARGPAAAPAAGTAVHNGRGDREVAARPAL